MDRGQVLRKGPEKGVLAVVPGCLRTLRDRFGPHQVVASQRKLVEELAHRVTEVLTAAGAFRDARERLTQALR